MFLLIVGLIIWTIAHLLRSFAKDFRQSLQDKFGNGSKGIIALAIVASLVLMIIGYRGADVKLLWVAPVWMIYVNNILMILALYVYFTTATKPGTAFFMGSLKNPQLTGFKIWAVAHLLVNGDLASVVLFGGLLCWAVVEVIASKRTVSLVNRDKAPISSPWVHLVLVAAMFILIVALHSWAGRSPFALSV